MLQQFLIPQLDEDDQEGSIHFQQDGAPPHYLGEVRGYFNTHFPGQWIGRAVPLAWPPRSPDLTHLNLFIRGFINGYTSVVINIQFIIHSLPYKSIASPYIFYLSTLLKKKHNGFHYLILRLWSGFFFFNYNLSKVIILPHMQADQALNDLNGIYPIFFPPYPATHTYMGL
jgi:hypothetical protein